VHRDSLPSARGRYTDYAAPNAYDTDAT